VKHLLNLPFIFAAMFLIGQADPAVGPTANTSIPHVSTSQVHPNASPYSGPQNGPVSHASNGAPCGPRPQPCAQPVIIIDSGPYTNYQVISPSTTTITPNSNVAGYSSYVASPQVIYSPVTLAPSAPPVPVGTIDDKGLVHSPFSKSVLKTANVRSGQAVHDPETGQVFYVQMSGTRLSNQID